MRRRKRNGKDGGRGKKARKIVGWTRNKNVRVKDSSPNILFLLYFLGA